MEYGNFAYIVYSDCCIKHMKNMSECSDFISVTLLSYRRQAKEIGVQKEGFQSAQVQTTVIYHSRDSSYPCCWETQRKGEPSTCK